MVSVRVVLWPRQIRQLRSARLPSMVFTPESRVPTDAARTASLQISLRESEMTLFADWPRYYNNRDIGPFTKALAKMKEFYAQRGIDICKDAVSLPGVSLQYLLKGIDSKSKNKLYTLRKKAYKHLKAAVVTYNHEEGVTNICLHKKNCCKATS